ncbi:hypothetical protein BC829DRAFT_493433 [Chytridium lagenaria]|nr:hypothetical protein BC829DRAFT_493433 [Chytridium lagenaria]
MIPATKNVFHQTLLLALGFIATSVFAQNETAVTTTALAPSSSPTSSRPGVAFSIIRPSPEAPTVLDHHLNLQDIRNGPDTGLVWTRFDQAFAIGAGQGTVRLPADLPSGNWAISIIIDGSYYSSPPIAVRGGGNVVTTATAQSGATTSVPTTTAARAITTAVVTTGAAAGTSTTTKTSDGLFGKTPVWYHFLPAFLYGILFV